MEKKTSFMSLVYREYCLTKKSVPGTVITLVMTYAICIMYTLSARFGNVAKAAVNPDLSEFIELMTPIVHIMGIFTSFTLFLISADGSTADLKNKIWRLYRKALPARPFQLAMARIVYQITAFIISAGVSFLFILADCLISGKSIDRGDFGVMAVISALIVLMGVSMTVCVELMRSTDKGMLMSMGVIFAVIIPFFILNKSSTKTMSKEEIQAMFDSFANYTPLIIAVIVMLFISETVLLTMLYKRRDK